MTRSEPTETKVAWIILLGMVLRLCWVLLVPVEPVSDSAAYDTFARTLVEHGVYGWSASEPSAYWAVGTAAVTAFTYLILGDTYAGVIALNLITSLLLMYFVWKVADFYFGAAAAFWSVVIIACWPNLIFFTSILSSELYFMMLTMAGLYFWSRPSGNPVINLLLCGLIWGLACYIRPVILLFPVAMAIAAFSNGWRATGIGLVKAGVTVCLIILTVLPWTLRNAEVIGKPYLVSSNFGTNLWMGNNPASDGSYTPLPPQADAMGEVEREEFLGAAAKTYIREDPARFLRTVARRIVDLHGRETIGVVWNQSAITRYVGNTGSQILKAVASGYWLLLVMSALVSLVILWPRLKLGALFHPIFGGWAYFTSVHAIIVSGDRYHMPSSPFVAVLAGVTIAFLVSSRVRQSKDIK